MIFEAISIPALFAQMGDWTYFSTVMQLDEVAKRVRFAEEVNQLREGHQLSDLIQRALASGRSLDISRYLQESEDHFFNSIVVAVYGGDPQWLEFGVGQALSDQRVASVPDWAKSTFGFLHLTGAESLFALDGQHRLSGIRKAVEVNPELGSERISVIFVGHKTDVAGRIRTRKLFTTLNKTAVPVNKSEIIALDESDAFAIITRRLVETDPFFQNGQILTRYGTANLSADDVSHYMTIIKLYDVVAFIVCNIINTFTADQKAKARYVRMSDTELERQYRGVVSFFRRMASSFSDLKIYFDSRGEDSREIIRVKRRDEKNVLFRSVGLDVFLRVIRKLMIITGDWKEAVDAAANLPRRFTEQPYRDVLYDMSEGKILLGRTRLVTELLLYMLRASDATEDLKRKYGEALGNTGGAVRLPRRLERPAQLG